ncbi:phage terminase small subunit [Salininema proteolyticum]|uniref:Terminase small subunit n=1 Tax=Salininema proteolyticum TaxID=1607685 RepID=A0ABV8TYZ3_9ACTN
MGARGPVPARDDELARPRERKGVDQSAGPAAKGKSLPAVIPEPDAEWHPIARLLWDAARTSGQSAWYQSSDWAVLYSICDDVSYYKRSKKRSGQMLAAINSAMTALLLTEGDRRRVRIELEVPESPLESPALAAIENYKKLLGKMT